MDIPLTIHETAFVTASFRSTDVELSGDHFACLWKQPQADRWIETYLQEVSPEEPFTHCLRNRFFLDTLNQLVNTSAIKVVINFGCGFSMYPFLSSGSLVYIDIDKPEIVDFKKQMTNQWQLEKKLPVRNVHYIGVDFTSDYAAALRSRLLPIINGAPVFIIIEGVLFFLQYHEAVALFNFFNTLQQPGDYIGSGSFEPSIKETPVFLRLLKFLKNTIPETEATSYLTIDAHFYRTRPHYELVDHQDYFSLAATYHHPANLPPGEVLNEHGYLLKKISA